MMAHTTMIHLIMTGMKGQHSTIIQHLKLQNPIMFYISQEDYHYK